MKINNPVPKIDPFDVWNHYLHSNLENYQLYPIFEKYGYKEKEDTIYKFFNNLNPIELWKVNTEMKRLENESK